jgi:hypothetical protein
LIKNWPCFSIQVGCNTQNVTLFQHSQNWSLVSDANLARVSAEFNIVALFQTQIWHLFQIEVISGHGHDLHMVSDSNESCICLLWLVLAEEDRRVMRT